MPDEAHFADARGAHVVAGALLGSANPNGVGREHLTPNAVAPATATLT